MRYCYRGIVSKKILLQGWGHQSHLLELIELNCTFVVHSVPTVTLDERLTDHNVPCYRKSIVYPFFFKKGENPWLLESNRIQSSYKRKRWGLQLPRQTRQPCLAKYLAHLLLYWIVELKEGLPVYPWKVLKNSLLPFTFTQTLPPCTYLLRFRHKSLGPQCKQTGITVMRFIESVCNSWLRNLSLDVCPVDDMSDCLNRVDASRAVTVIGRVPKPNRFMPTSARSVPWTRVRLYRGQSAARFASPSSEQWTWSLFGFACVALWTWKF